VRKGSALARVPGGDFVLEGAYPDYLRIFEGKIPPFAAFALGKIRLIKGSL
jgi:putative sterol carrier protein